MLAEQALRAFGVEGVASPITQTESDVYEVATAGGERMALRIHRAGARTREAVASELAWLAALRAETELVVPEPVADPRGEPVVEVASRLCVLFRWVDGELGLPGVTPELYQRVGRFVGHLHEHAAAWRPPAGFRRGRFDMAAAARSTPDAAFVRRMPPGAAPLMARVHERFRAAYAALGEGPEAFGLIHADLHQFNVLLHRGEVRAIDFDDCCFGHWAYDLAVALVGAGPWRTTAEMRAAFLAGYREVRELPAEQEAALGPFMALRRLLLLKWALPEDEEPVGPLVEELLGKVEADLAG